jgi:hypothetical protein
MFLASSCSRFSIGTYRMGDLLGQRIILYTAYYKALTRNRGLLLEPAAPFYLPGHEMP